MSADRVAGPVVSAGDCETRDDIEYCRRFLRFGSNRPSSLCAGFKELCSGRFLSLAMISDTVSMTPAWPVQGIPTCSARIGEDAEKIDTERRKPLQTAAKRAAPEFILYSILLILTVLDADGLNC